MLVVHWTSVGATKRIIKNGITKSKKGLYCFPLTGNKQLDKWWVSFFKVARTRNRKRYNGIVFKVTQADLPAYFGHWIAATSKDNFEKPIKTIKELTQQLRENILFRLGEKICQERQDNTESEKFIAIAENELRTNRDLKRIFASDVDLKTYTLEDFQIVLASSVPAKRILKIIPEGSEFGKVSVKRKIDKRSKRELV